MTERDKFVTRHCEEPPSHTHTHVTSFFCLYIFVLFAYRYHIAATPSAATGIMSAAASASVAGISGCAVVSPPGTPG